MENLDQILDAPIAEKKRLQYAGFWIRVVAYFLDSILLGIGNVIVIFVFDDPESIAPSFISIAIGLLYFGLMESSENQASLGKMAVGIRVGNERGERITLANALGRYLGKILSALVLCIGFMMVGWDDRKQGLHDKLADTVVYYR
jgi:uncharacterized RDD family membrane protein YckC